MLWVGIGGGCGAMLRYALSSLARRYYGVHAVPYATLVVNVVGCFALGFLLEWLALSGRPDADRWRLLIGVGGLGGFTTFSTFGVETWTLREQHLGLACLSVILHVGCGLAAVALGMNLARRF